MISNCGKDERGKLHGGKPGDQTGGEWEIRTWYNRPWNCILRHPDPNVRNEMASLHRAAALNSYIGYCQSHRGTYYAHLKASSWEPSKITIACEADCSSGVAANVAAVGYRLSIRQLQYVSTGLTTHNMRAALKSCGFQVFTDRKYLVSDQYLLPGDILLNDSSHVAVNLDRGVNAHDTTENTANNEGGRYMFSVSLVKRGSVGKDVLLFQKIAKSTGDYVGQLDQEYGPLCEEACKRIQSRFYPQCGECDGECGVKTWPYVLGV